jgi:hypothetical protein
MKSGECVGHAVLPHMFTDPGTNHLDVCFLERYFTVILYFNIFWPK